jgi:hypothetical protein
MHSPRVTVLMCVFNGEEFLREAVDSVLAQTFSDFELVLIDDCSTDGSAEILASYDDCRLRVTRNEQNLGLTVSLNIGLQLARGEFVARQDADDVSHPTRLDSQVAFLDREADVAMVGTRVRIIDDVGRTLRPIVLHRTDTCLGAQWQLLFGSPFAHSSVMFRRAIVLAELGGYNESFRFSQDFELWSRLLRRHEAMNLPETLLDYRSHAGSIVGMRGAHVLESRRHNAQLNLALLRSNAERLLDSPELATAWSDLWLAINASWMSGDPPRPERALDWLEDVRASFARVYPQASRDPEIRHHIASVYMFLAYYLATRNRAASVRALTRAIRSGGTRTAIPGHVASVAAGIVLGNRGLDSLRLLRAKHRGAGAR